MLRETIFKTALGLLCEVLPKCLLNLIDLNKPYLSEFELLTERDIIVEEDLEKEIPLTLAIKYASIMLRSALLEINEKEKPERGIYVKLCKDQSKIFWEIIELKYGVEHYILKMNTSGKLSLVFDNKRYKQDKEFKLITSN